MTGFEHSSSAASARLPRAPLYGLVLAGGRGARLGCDKGGLDYHGSPQAQWAFALLQRFCVRVYVSVRTEQVAEPAFAGLPAVVDAVSRGPASGLAAAARFAPRAAWLVLAADLPLVDGATLGALRAARRADCAATAFRHPDGTLEPLCAIYEPSVLVRLATYGEDAGDPGDGISLRRLLEDAGTATLEAPEPSRLRSVNTPADDAAVRARLGSEAR